MGIAGRGGGVGFRFLLSKGWSWLIAHSLPLPLFPASRNRSQESKLCRTLLCHPSDPTLYL
jgi:hypothetical protein